MSSKKKEKDISNQELKQQNIKLKSDLDGFKRLIILLIVLVVISVVSQGLYFYALEYAKKTEHTNEVNRIESDKEEVEETESLDIDSTEVTNLIGEVDVFNDQLDAGNFFGYLYKKDSYTVSQISNKAKIYMAITNISFVDDDTLMDEEDHVVIPKEMVKDKMIEIFGETVTYEDEALVDDGNDCRMAYFGYDSENGNYFLNSFGHNQAAYSNTIETQIFKATKTKNVIEIDVLMYKSIPTTDGFTIYKDMDSETKITSFKHGEDVDVFEKYKEKLQQYRYTFVLEKNRYIFSKVEKIN